MSLDVTGIIEHARALGTLDPIKGLFPRHGLLSTYTNHRCRCIPCRLANRDYIRIYQRARRLRLAQQDIPQRALRAIS